jgi:hypothetical protein
VPVVVREHDVGIDEDGSGKVDRIEAAYQARTDPACEADDIGGDGSLGGPRQRIL